jgi:hypothetical protein
MDVLARGLWRRHLQGVVEWPLLFHSQSSFHVYAPFQDGTGTNGPHGKLQASLTCCTKWNGRSYCQSPCQGGCRACRLSLLSRRRGSSDEWCGPCISISQFRVQALWTSVSSSIIKAAAFKFKTLPKLTTFAFATTQCFEIVACDTSSTRSISSSSTRRLNVYSNSMLIKGFDSFYLRITNLAKLIIN